MSVMNALGYAAAAILLLELLVVALMFAGIAGGLAFGLHWVNGKTAWAFEKVNVFPPKVRQYVHIGTTYVGKPFILVNSWMDRIEETVGSLRRQVQAARDRREAQEAAAKRAAQSTKPSVVAGVQETAEVPINSLYAGDTLVAARPVAPPPPTDPLT
jgi:hypothetical protein